MDEHIPKDIHILKLNILGCDRTTPLKQNQGLVTKRRVRAKRFIKETTR
jgi:hypothetical protein